jgi:hypothetical protein
MWDELVSDMLETAESWVCEVTVFSPSALLTSPNAAHPHGPGKRRARVPTNEGHSCQAAPAF